MNNGFVILTVSQLNLYARSLLYADSNLNGIFLKGEISNFTNHYRSGHFYMSLKDENAVIKAVMFKGNAQKLLFLPQDGMKVIVTGRASIYDRDGQYQFYIDDMQPDGAGALHIAFEQLKEKLRMQGLFDEAIKKPLPKYPSRIGVVT
ncbi:MAG: exodeoxyribonuclease VII large subunit, partial [Clostridia bacterium]|nr:exodeoxyribonuclease VII large subunit [Clostridia bacterium]